MKKEYCMVCLIRNTDFHKRESSVNFGYLSFDFAISMVKERPLSPKLSAEARKLKRKGKIMLKLFLLVKAGEGEFFVLVPRKGHSIRAAVRANTNVQFAYATICIYVRR